MCAMAPEDAHNLRTIQALEARLAELDESLGTRPVNNKPAPSSLASTLGEGAARGYTLDPDAWEAERSAELDHLSEQQLQLSRLQRMRQQVELEEALQLLRLRTIQEARNGTQLDRQRRLLEVTAHMAPDDVQGALPMLMAGGDREELRRCREEQLLMLRQARLVTHRQINEDRAAISEALDQLEDKKAETQERPPQTWLRTLQAELGPECADLLQLLEEIAPPEDEDDLPASGSAGESRSFTRTEPPPVPDPLLGVGLVAVSLDLPLPEFREEVMELQAWVEPRVKDLQGALVYLAAEAQGSGTGPGQLPGGEEDLSAHLEDPAELATRLSQLQEERRELQASIKMLEAEEWEHWYAGAAAGLVADQIQPPLSRQKL